MAPFTIPNPNFPSGPWRPIRPKPPAPPPTMNLLQAYNAGKDGHTGRLSATMARQDPIENFALLASFFAGKQETVMNNKLKEYEDQHNEYKKVLRWSKYAHEKKAYATNKDKAVHGSGSYKNYMNGITNNRFTNEMDKNKDNKHNKDEWQSQIDVINKEKDMQSTELNKISTEMDMAVKDSSEAEQMAANAVKKANDLMSTQAKTSGG